MSNPNTGQLGRDLRGLLPAPSVIALTDRPGNRKPIKELIEGKYLKVEGGEIVAADGGGGGVDDHKVAADATDTAPDFLQGKLKDGDHLAWTLDTAGGIHKLRGDVTWPTIPSGPTASLEIPLPDGVGDPGDTSSNEYAAKRHVHPALTPAAAASTLYTAQKLDPNDHGQVVSVFISYTSCAPSLWAGWTEISPGVMQKNTTGWLSSAQFDGTMVIPPAGLISGLVGKTVLAYAGPGESTYDQALSGPYVVEDAGGSWVWTLDIPTSTYYWLYVPTYARMRRAPGYDAAAGFVQNMTFQTQTGNVYGTGFFTLTTPQPITLDVTPLAWTFTPGPTYPWVLTKELLTNSQLVSEGVSSATLSTSVTTGGTSLTVIESFPTLIGTPGLSGLPAGPWKFDMEGVWLDADVGGSTAISVRVVRVSGGATDLFTTPGVIIHNSVPAPLSITYNAPSFPWSPTDQLVALYQIQNTIDTTPLTVTGNLIYNSASRLTRVTVPFDMAGGTSGDHRFLSHRNDPSQHPATAVDTDTTNFNKNLSSADTTVQLALDTIDNLNIPIGTGNLNYIPKWTSASTLGNSQIFDNGTIVGIGNATGPGLLSVGAGAEFQVSSAGVVTAANITATPTATRIPISDISGTLNSWVTHASGDVPSNTAITASGATYKIVQYDTKGLVLAGIDATPANVGAVGGSGTMSGTLNYLPVKTAGGWGDSRITDNAVSGTTTLAGGTAPAGYPALLKLTGASYLGIDLTGLADGYAFSIANNQFIRFANTSSAQQNILGVSVDNNTYLGASSGNSIRIATPLGYGNTNGITVSPTTNYVGIGKTPADLLDVAGAVGALSLKLNGATSGTITHGVAATTASYSLLDPATSPGAGQVIAYPSGGGQGVWATPTALPTSATGWLYNDGSGVLSWSASTIASSIATSTTNVSIGTTAPTGVGQTLVTTSTTAVTWQTVATLSSSTPTALTYGGAGSAGSGTTASKYDHVHPLAQITSTQVINALGYTPGAGNGTVTGSGNSGYIPKWTSTTALGNSQITDDGSTVTVGTIANAILRVNAGSTSWYIGQLSDNTGYSGMAVASGGITNANYVLAANVTTGTILNANATKTVYFNIGNVNYASVSNTGIAASNITATPTASKIPIADGSGTLNSWVNRAASYVSLLGIIPTGFADIYGNITTTGAIIGAVYLAPSLFPHPTKVVHIWAQCAGSSGSWNWVLYDIANGSSVAASGTLPFSATAIQLSQSACVLTGSGQYQLQISTYGLCTVRIFSANFVNAP